MPVVADAGREVLSEFGEAAGVVFVGPVEELDELAVPATWESPAVTLFFFLN